MAVDASDIKRTQFSVSDFLDWQRQRTLILNPPFQRRSVWKPGAKSYLIDTVVRGLPTPLLFIREKIDLDTLRPTREVIDGQQRLRTLLAFIESSILDDYEEARDAFVVQPEHNPSLAGKRFSQLERKARANILGYEFSTHVLPSSTEDRDVLMIFARLNSTGTPLNYQELRNAQYFGKLKTLAYELAYEQLERWLRWRIFTEDDVSRMREVELTSDLLMNMKDGLTGKSQPKLNKFYERYDEELDGHTELARRFRIIMDAIEESLGDGIRRTVFTSEVYFFTLFVFLYDVQFGLGSALKRETPRPLPRGLDERLVQVSRAFRTQDVPPEVLDAVQRASADLGRRRTRLEYLKTASLAGTRK